MSQTKGSPTDALNQMTTSSTYDFNTGLMLSSTDANGRVGQTIYDTNSLRPVTAILSTGAHADYSYDDANLTLTETTYLESHPTHTTIANQNVKLVNGRGQVRQEKVLGAGGVWDIVDTVYDSSGRVTQKSRPYRSGDTIRWNTSAYDALSRVISTTAPDGSVVQTFYNESSRPNAASSTPGDTTRVVDPWGRERWGRTDAQGRLVEVVEPDPNGSGSVATNGMATTYGYNTLGSLTSVTQGSQTRSFKYDSLGRLLAQKLAEANATLNDAGTYVGSGTWSEVFTYDSRSNLTSRKDARGVKTIYTYNNDPFNRLQSISYDTSGFGDTGNPILAAASVTYAYRTKSSGSDQKDITQLVSTTTSGISTETLTYDSEGRVSSKTLALSSRPSYPFVTDYIYDALHRNTDVRYPAEYGNGSQLRKLVHHNYDVASRLNSLTVDGASHASNITYNAASQATSLKVGVSGANQITENYGYNSVTGLLESQTVVRGASTLLNLGYNYAGANGKHTGQLVSISNNLDHNKDRGYQYDALGRLKRATSGQNVNSAQRYYYDRYGNRNNAFSHTADQFIRNFYLKALVRQPNSTELNSWLSTLQTAYAQGPSQFWTAMQNLGAAVFTSQEYINRNRTDHWYVYDLYQAYLWRDPDAGGWAHWEANTAAVGRNATRAGFDWSLEFELHVSGTSPYSPPGGATVPGDGWGSLHYDNANNRINDPGWNYDAAGNQTRVQNGAGWQRFQYDAANRLVKVKADDNVTVLASYTYGSSRQRLISEEAGQRTYSSADDGSVIAEFTEIGGGTIPYWSKSYIYIGARLLSTLTPNGAGGAAVDYHHPDRLGTRIVSNAQNTNSFEQVTLPFGTAISSESTGATNRRFTTYDRSATTGLDYAVNRTYDSQQGRFTQVDPIGMNASSLEHPQSLNLYSYVANDPVNRTDPDGLFWGAIKRFFKKLGKIFSAVAAAVSKVLNNRWVRIAMFALDFILPGLGRLTSAFGKALTAAVKLGLKIYNKVADIVSALQLAGMALQGQWKNFLTSVGLGIVGGMVAQVTDAIKKGMQNALWPKTPGVKFDELGDLFAGAWKGLKDGLKKLGATIEHAFDNFPKNLVPWSGNYCSPAATEGGNPDGGLISSGISGYDESVCHAHDRAYTDSTGKTNQNALRRDADWAFVRTALFGWGDPGVTSWDIAFSGQYGGRPLIGSVHKFFSVPIFMISGTVRSFKK
ncbi:MAG TPA: RHS repeat-associated core domain-containing protein [Pyrinomonadaceae bacterium]|nr:RHS repeat-associated core domain-containing protein [Pyrinomonadaceae bacterium]